MSAGKTFASAEAVASTAFWSCEHARNRKNACVLRREGEREREREREERRERDREISK